MDNAFRIEKYLRYTEDKLHGDERDILFHVIISVSLTDLPDPSPCHLVNDNQSLLDCSEENVSPTSLKDLACFHSEK